MWSFKKKSTVFSIKEKDWIDLAMGEHEHLKRQQRMSGLSSSGYGSSSYEQERRIRDIQSVVRNELMTISTEADVKANIKLVTGMIKAFKLDYGTGEEVLNLVKTNNQDNEKIAITMLFSAMRNGLKEEIMNEINKK